MDAVLLAQRLQSAEKSIGFIQREHAATLVSLHEEITKWQQKCSGEYDQLDDIPHVLHLFSDLTFQLAINGTSIESTDTSKLTIDVKIALGLLLLFTDKLQKKVKQLENELDHCRDKIQNLNQLLAEKDRLLGDYENRLLVNERKHALELHIQHDKQQELKIELEQRAILIAQLTHQIHRDKQQSVRNPLHLGQIILPNKLPKSKQTDEQSLSSPRRISNRSTSLSNRIHTDQELTEILFIGRRPPTPPQQLQPLYAKPLETNDEQIHGKRHRQFWNTHHSHQVDSNNVISLRSTKKLSTTLPPIVNKKLPLKTLPTTTLEGKGET